MNSRVPIPARLRFQILDRDGFRCRYCGADAADSQLHVDHVNPVALNGGNDWDNLVTACRDCNLGKHSARLRPVVIAQREMALAANIWERAAEKFGSQMPLWEAWQLIEGLCLCESEPERFMDAIRSGAKWDEAKAALFRISGCAESDWIDP